MALARHGLPHQGHPSEKYSLNWETEQAGSGWLGVGNYYGFSIVLIKKIEIDEPRAEFPNLQRAFHENIVGLVEAFYDNTNIYLAYYYHSFAVNLSQVISTPTIKLNELELASISRSVLRGLEYIHEKLQIVHGNVDGDNILLCPDGMIKLANVGSAMIVSQTSPRTDRENVGSFLVRCLGQDQMSTYATHFVGRVGSDPYSCLFEHIFLQQANADSQAWYLIPHYLDTMIYWKGLT